MELRLPLARSGHTASAEAGFSLVPLRTAGGVADGLALIPYGMGTASRSVDLGGGWSLEYRVSGNVTIRYGVVVSFDTVSVRALDEGAGVPVGVSLRTRAAVRRYV